MKFFEFKRPYYALIKADSFENAVSIYADEVCDFEEEGDIDYLEIGEIEAYNKLTTAHCDSIGEAETILTDFHDDEFCGTILIDGNFI